MALHIVLSCGQPAAYRIFTRGYTVALKRCLGLLSRSFKGGGKRRQVACQVVELLKVGSIAAYMVTLQPYV